MIPLTGWSMERFGGRRMWMLSVVLFLVGSVLCGLAWSTESLIVFRVLQGFGGGMIMPIGQAILAQAAGPQRMGRIMAVIGVPTLLGPILGPGHRRPDRRQLLLALDLLRQRAGGRRSRWRWPRGSCRAAERARPRRASWTCAGCCCSRPGSRCWSSGCPRSGIAGVASADWRVLVGVGRRARCCSARSCCTRVRGRGRSLIDLALFRDRAFAAASGTTFIFGVSLFGAMLILPLYYQVVRGESALAAGLLLAPQGVGRGDRDADRGAAHRPARRGADRALRRRRRAARHRRSSRSSTADTSYCAARRSRCGCAASGWA